MEVTRIARHVPGLLAVLDDMEIWQIAAALGVHDPPVADADGPIRSPRGSGTIAKRMAAAAAGQPEPGPDAPDPSVVGLAAEFAARVGLTDGGTAR